MHLGKTCFWDGFLMPKWEALNAENRAGVRYLLRFTRFRCFAKRHWKWERKGINNHLKIELWALRCPICGILDVFFWGHVLYAFLIGKKVTPNHRRGVKLCPVPPWGEPVPVPGGGFPGKPGAKAVQISILIDINIYIYIL